MKSLVPALIAPVLLLSSLATQTPAEEPFALKPHDTVVFYGDSITDQRLYTMLTELFIVTRYPKLDVKFVDSGWGGDKVSGGGGGPVDTRLARDVIAYHPNVMTIMLGMNDGKYANHSEADDTAYYDGYHHIVDSVEKSIPKLRVTLIGPSPFDDVTRAITLQPDGYNAIMVRYSDYLKKYAEESKLGYADLNTGVVAMLRTANRTDPAVAQKIIPDRVHPSLAGHLIMAEQLLKAWHARPVVSAVSIDAAAGKVSASAFTKVSELHAGTPLSWAETDEALPLPFANMLAVDKDKTLDLTIRSSDVTDALNQEPLHITGLAAGRYQVMIDGGTVGTYSEAELAQGVNLALLDTPMSRQAMKVHDLVVDRLNVHQERWRTLQVPMASLDLLHLDDAIKALDTLDTELATRERQAAQPLPHVYQVSPVQ
jgi:lysophospholipase L1-like esterase